MMQQAIIPPKDSSSESKIDNKEYMNKVHYFDLGTECAFLSMADIMAFGIDSKNWPKLTKETDAARKGSLLSARTGIFDKANAGKAYAIMNVGESNACKAAGRWLNYEINSMSHSYEENIRKMLQGVSDNDVIVLEKPKRPSFCHTEKKSYAEDILEFGFGTRPANAAVIAMVAAACTNLNDGWVVVGSGGRSLEFTDGDFDVIVYNKKSGTDASEIIRILSNLSATGRTTLMNNAGGLLLTVYDVLIAKESIAIDIMFPKDGEAAAGKSSIGGITFCHLMEAGEYRAYFSIIRRRARGAGIVNGANGMFNMYSIMLTALEYLIIDRRVITDQSRPLSKSNMTFTEMGTYDVASAVRDYFIWMLTSFKDPEHVFMSMRNEKVSKRSESEYKTSIAYKICRDPFASKVDNTMRTLSIVRKLKVETELAHCAYCQMSRPHAIESVPIEDRSCDNNLDSMGEVTEEFVSKEGTKIMFIAKSSNYIFMSDPSKAFGIGDNEINARGRAILNSQKIVKQDINVLFGPNIMEEHNDKITVDTFLNSKVWNRVYCSYEDGNIYVGSCVEDLIGDTEALAPACIRDIEIIMQCLALRGKM